MSAVIAFEAGGVGVRHQQGGAFDLSFAGNRPVLLFLFAGPEGPRPGGEEACRRGSFALIPPRSPVGAHGPGPQELLALTYEPAAALLGDDPVFDLVDDGVRTLAQEIRRVALNEPDGGGDYVEGLARTMLVRALQVAGRDAQPRARAHISPSALRRVLAFIGEHLAEHVEVTDLAAVAGLSRPYFTRAFEAATGETPHRFIVSRRLALVRERLEGSDEDLATIAVRAGFSSHAHMTTAFRRAYGVTPAVFRAGVRPGAALRRNAG
jgi:AraC family transcriptional regulator